MKLKAQLLSLALILGLPGASAAGIFFISGSVYDNAGNSGTASTHNSFSGMTVYRDGLAGNAAFYPDGVVPTAIEAAAGNTYVARFLYDAGSIWDGFGNPEALGQTLVAVGETRAGQLGYGNWLSYVWFGRHVISSAEHGSSLAILDSANQQAFPYPIVVSATASSVQLSWTQFNDPSGAISSYSIYRATYSPGLFAPYPASALLSATAPHLTWTSSTGFLDSGLSPSTTYHYQIAPNFRWEGGASSGLGANPSLPYYTSFGQSASNTATTAGDGLTALLYRSMELSVWYATMNIGQRLTVTMSVSNVGSDTIHSIVPSALNQVGPGSCVLLSGPIPASHTLTPGNTGIFTWLYSATGAGTVLFQGSASGTENLSGNPKTSPLGTSPGMEVQAPAELFLSAIVASPSGPLVGAQITTVMYVQNVGQAVANTMTASLSAFGSGTASYVSGPTGPFFLLGGQSGSYTFVYQLTGPGCVTFSGFASGQDYNTHQGEISLGGSSNTLCNAPSPTITPTFTASRTATFGPTATQTPSQTLAQTFTASPTPSPSPSRSATFTISPTRTASSTPVAHGSLVADFEGASGLTVDHWGGDLQAIYNLANSSLTVTAGAGFGAGVSACLSGSLGANVVPYPFAELGLGLGGGIDVDVAPYAGGQALSLEYKAGASSVGKEHRVYVRQPGINDYDWYFYGFVPADTAWHTLTIHFPGTGAPQFAQGGWGTPVAWSTLMGGIHIMPYNSSTTLPMPFDLCIDNLRFDAVGVTASPSPTPTTTRTPSPVPGGTMADEIADNFEDGDLLTRHGGGIITIVDFFGSNCVTTIHGPGCDHGSANYSCGISGTLAQDFGADPYGRCRFELVPGWAPVDMTNIANYHSCTISFRNYTPGVTYRFCLESSAVLDGDEYCYTFTPTGTGWQDLTIYFPDVAGGGLARFAQAGTGAVVPWGNCVTGIRSCRFEALPSVSGPVAFNCDIDDIHFGSPPARNQRDAVCGAMGGVLGNCNQAYDLQVDEMLTWILIRLSVICGCTPHDIYLMRQTMSWGQIATSVGTSWAAVVADVEARAAGASLCPDVDLQQAERGLINNPSLTPQMTPQYYVPGGPMAVGPSSAGCP